jgi:hypothetical protein
LQALVTPILFADLGVQESRELFPRALCEGRSSFCDWRSFVTLDP